MFQSTVGNNGMLEMPDLPDDDIHTQNIRRFIITTSPLENYAAGSVSLSTILRTRGATTSTVGKAIGHAVAKPLSHN